MQGRSLREPAAARAATNATAEAGAIEQCRRIAVKGRRGRPLLRLWRHDGNAIGERSVPGHAAGSDGHGKGLPDPAKDTRIFAADNPS
jgi:hypothetical protein